MLRTALSSAAEPLPGYGYEDMHRLSAYIGQLAQKKGIEEFHQNHPSKSENIFAYLQFLFFVSLSRVFFLNESLDTFYLFTYG